MIRHVAHAKIMSQALEDLDKQPFDWAERNCLSAACDVVAAMTGEDPLAAYRGTYADEAAAMAIVAQHGDLFGFVSHILDQEPMENPLYSCDGDVWVIDLPNGPTAGILVTTAIWCMEREGMLKIPREVAMTRRHAAWAIGR